MIYQPADQCDLLPDITIVLKVPLDPTRISRTAILTAAVRAYTSHEFDPLIRNPDWLADPFLSPDEIAMLDTHPAGRAVNQDIRIAALDPEVSGLARPILVATRYIDERLDRALREGISQVVILNAGLDTRPYRLRPRLLGKRVIEVDGAATQQLKKRRVEIVLGEPPPYLIYAAADLEREDLTQVLRSAGLRASERAFFLWESASMHYPEEAVRRTLRAIAQTAPKGSLLVMDFVPEDQVEKMNRDPGFPQARWAREWGEPWVFGVPGAYDAFFGELGLEPRDLLETHSVEATARYLTRRDGTVFGPPRNASGAGYEEFHARILAEAAIIG
jgi:methyltransferase (TIGR00027 family)